MFFSFVWWLLKVEREQKRDDAFTITEIGDFVFITCQV